MKNDLIYVICITDGSDGIDQFLTSAGLKSLVVNNFCLIIKYVSDNEFSPDNFKKNLKDLHWRESKVAEHFKTVSQLMNLTSVIPFKFGTIYKTEIGIKKLFKEYTSTLNENFLRLRGKEEWSVRAYCDRRFLCEQIDEISKVAADLERQIMASSPGKAYLLQRKKTEIVKIEIDRICQDYSQFYFDNFKDLSELSSLAYAHPKDSICKEGTMILNASFLIKKDKVSSFKKTADAMRNRDKDSGFFLEATGPLPPYSFVDIMES